MEIIVYLSILHFLTIIYTIVYTSIFVDLNTFPYNIGLQNVQHNVASRDVQVTEKIFDLPIHIYKWIFIE